MSCLYSSYQKSEIASWLSFANMGLIILLQPDTNRIVQCTGRSQSSQQGMEKDDLASVAEYRAEFDYILVQHGLV